MILPATALSLATEPTETVRITGVVIMILIGLVLTGVATWMLRKVLHPVITLVIGLLVTGAIAVAFTLILTANSSDAAGLWVPGG